MDTLLDYAIYFGLSALLLYFRRIFQLFIVILILIHLLDFQLKDAYIY